MTTSTRRGTSDKTCPVCLSLCVKPAALPCGHVACLWCTHCAMSSLGESHCAVCRNVFTALPALSHAIENHTLWCDAAAFGERLREAREEELARGQKSPKFEVLRLKSAGKHDVVDFGDALGREEDDGAIAKRLEESEDVSSALGACATFDPESGRAVAAFHACSCPGMRDDGDGCGELASRPVVCQQCGALYERAHADVLTARAGDGGEWCECGAIRPPTAVVFVLKEDIESVYPNEFIDASRRRCDEVLAESLAKLKLERKAEREAEVKASEETVAEVKTRGEIPEGEEHNGEGDGNDGNGEGDSNDHATVNVRGAGTLVFDHETFTHYGVGCDFCGVYPIVGPRYQCKECKELEFMGFDLCSKCMQSVFEHPDRKRDYRFAQNHTDKHEMVLVRPRPTMIHVMKSLHPELSEDQIIHWLESQAMAAREADAENGDDGDENADDADDEHAAAAEDPDADADANAPEPSNVAPNAEDEDAETFEDAVSLFERDMSQ